MKALAVVNIGLEDISIGEIKELVGVKGSSQKGLVHFDVTNVQELAKFAYLTQSANRVIALLFETTFTSQEELFSKVGEWAKSVAFDTFMDKPTLKVKAQRFGTHNFSSIDLQDHITKIVAQKFTIDMDNPGLQLFAQIIDDRCVVGVDASGFDLSKREYKIFSHAASLKGPVGYSVVRMSGFIRGESLVVIPCHDAVLAIEAASFAHGFSLNHFRLDNFAFGKWKEVDVEKIKKSDEKKPGSTIYAFDDNLQNLNAAKKNGKIAGLNEKIQFSKISIQWLDTKFDAGSIDRVIGSVIRPEKKVIQDLFYQSKFVLKTKGTLTIISRRKPEFWNFLEEYGFSLKTSTVLEKGESKLYVDVFEKR